MDIAEGFTRVAIVSQKRGCVGWPLENDPHLAIEIDWLVQAYDCDALIETGTCDGDTTEYFARAYPHRPVWTCELDADQYAPAAARLADLANVRCVRGSSPEFVAATRHFSRPFYFLDAHGNGYWPLLDELRAIRQGVVCIHDFDIGHPSFGYDKYHGVICGPELVRAFRPIYGNRPDATYPTSHKPGRRLVGRGYLVVGLENRLDHMPYVQRLL